MRTTTLFHALGLIALTLHAAATTLYVDLNSPSPTPPYTNWLTAATNIQDAVDVALDGDQVIVTDGIYAAGGRAVYGTMTNRVAIDRPITVRSVNGPEVTIIQGAPAPGATNGDGAIRCVYLTNGAFLTGFTLLTGATRTTGDSSREQSGGGLWCETASAVASNCVVTGNSAHHHGGGAYQGTLNDCTLASNWAAARIGKDGGEGGGAYSATLLNCTVTSNGAYYGGAAYRGTLTNCALVGNWASSYGGGAYSATLTDCSLTANSAASGGGAWSSSLGNCTLTLNSATDGGGGVAYGSLTGCTLTTNRAGHGGGALSSTLAASTLIGNSASYGGGAYEGTLSNCSLIANSASSSGGGACSSALNGCLLAGNSAFSGGGAYDAALNNCTLSNNWADFGGGASSGTLSNCTLVANFTVVHCEGCGEGAGAFSASLESCTLAGNRGGIGGGASRSTLNNCAVTGNSGSGVSYPQEMNNCTVVSNTWYGVVVGSTMVPSLKVRNSVIYYNASSTGGGNYLYAQVGSIGYCCTTPSPPGGIGNVTNAPQFVDPAAGDFRLQTNSPCINAGNNAYAISPTDLDGNPRIVSATVDIGAYEHQGTGSAISYAWLQQYGLPIDGSADSADPDRDAMNNWQEWIADTDPTNSLSVLTILGATNSPAGTTVRWQSVTTRTYYLGRATNLLAPPAFTSIRSNIVGQAGTTTCTDTNATGPGPYFYRVGVQ
jgi:hypothetical protein